LEHQRGEAQRVSGIKGFGKPRRRREIRQHSGALANVPAEMIPQVHVALADAFHGAFLACAVVMAVAVVIALGMRDLPLQTATSKEPAALAH
jgi:hypothetical protein